MIHKHQIEGLRKDSQCPGAICGFILNYRDTNHTYFLHIQDFDSMVLCLPKKSFHEQDLLRHAPVLIQQRLKRTTYAFYANILKFYTDYDGSGQGVDEVYRLINESDIVQIVELCISPIQYESIRAAIENKVAYFTKMQISAIGSRSPVDGLANDLRNLVGKWDKKLEKSFKPRVISSVLKNLSQMKVADQSLQDAVVAAFTSGMEKENDHSQSR